MLRNRLQKQRVISLEILLPVSTVEGDLLEAIETVVPFIDAVNIPSNPLGKLRPDPISFAHILRERLDVETIPHFVARHLTLLAYESRLLGAKALGIENILCVTGDTPVEGRSAFELDSSQLLMIARNLKQGLTSARKSIEPVDFCLCTSFNPNVPNIQGEFVKAASKYRCGAEVFFTQPVFSPARAIPVFKEFRARYKEAKIIAGLSFLYTQKRAFSLMKFMGIPYEHISRIEAEDEGSMLLSVAQEILPYIDGFYVITIGRYGEALGFLKELRTLCR
ncbi:MAG: methylenetetrahydrofolate reductase [candidate division WOR-3 bacterium]|nr:MAG: methylenetetrahydrofolate reductase [candidate division WOR-3 bacterium]